MTLHDSPNNQGQGEFERNLESRSEQETCADVFVELYQDLPLALVIFEKTLDTTADQKRYYDLSVSLLDLCKKAYEVFVAFVEKKGDFATALADYKNEVQSYRLNVSEILDASPSTVERVKDTVQDQVYPESQKDNLLNAISRAHILQLRAGTQAIHLWLGNPAALKLNYESFYKQLAAGKPPTRPKETIRLILQAMPAECKDVARAFAEGYPDIEVETQDLGKSLIRLIKKELEIEVEKTGESLTVTLENLADLKISISELLLKTWLENSATNSWKSYLAHEPDTQTGFELHLTCQVDTEKSILRLTLTDNGTGIKEKKIFKHGVGGYAGNQQPSNAMGMAGLADMVINEYGGDMYLLPSDRGRGATSVLEIPYGVVSGTVSPRV